MTAVDVLDTSDEEREAERGAPIEVAVAFTDLENFTTYTEAEGDDAASRLLIGHHRESAAIVGSRGGRVLKRLGDGLMLTFPEPEAAVIACLELGEAAPLRLRAGIHFGTVLVTDDDVIGHVVNLAARVTESAARGELVVTDARAHSSRRPSRRRLRWPVTRRFRGIEAKVPVYLASRRCLSMSGRGRAMKRLAPKGGRALARFALLESRPSTGRTADQVVSFDALGRSHGGGRVLIGGRLELAAELVEVGADRVPLVPVAEGHPHSLGLRETGASAGDVSDRNGSVEDSGRVIVLRIVAEGDQVVVPREDLWPVGLRRRPGVGVKRGDRGLDLVATRALLGERALQDRDTVGDLGGVPERAVLLVERDEPPGVVRARREPRCWSSISASRPRASGSGVARVSCRVSRIASRARSWRRP